MGFIIGQNKLPIQIWGNLSSDPKLKKISTATKDFEILEFNIFFREKSNEIGKEYSHLIKCTPSKNSKQDMRNYILNTFKKGDSIFCLGETVVNKYTNKDKIEVTNYEFKVEMAFSQPIVQNTTQELKSELTEFDFGE